MAFNNTYEKKLFAKGLWKPLSDLLSSITDPDRLEHAAQLNGAVAGAAKITGNWYAVPATFRLVFNGTGVCTIDTKTVGGTIVNTAFTYSYTSTSNTVVSFTAEDISQIRLNFPGTLTVQLLG